MFLKIKKYVSNNTGILIRLDDIAENMNWDLMKNFGECLSFTLLIAKQAFDRGP